MTDAATPISPRTLAWEERTAWPMFLLSIVFFTAWVWLLADVGLTATWRAALTATVAACWGAFIVDFVVRVLLSGHRAVYVRERWFELVSLVVAYLRPFVIIAYIWRVPWFSTTPGRQRLRLVISVSLFTVLFVLTASSLVWLVERNAPGANLVSIGDAIWWGFTTNATVGFGAYVPNTVPGRTIAVALMMGGFVVLGVTSATIISALTDQMQRVGKRRERELELARRASNPAPPAPPPPEPPDGGGSPSS